MYPMTRPCSFNHEGNLLYRKTGNEITPLGKGGMVTEGSLILSMPDDWNRGNPRETPGREHFDEAADLSDSYLHEMRNGKYRCIKAGKPKAGRAGPDRITFLLRKYAARSHLNATLKRACEIQGAVTEKDFANMRRIHRLAREMTAKDLLRQVVPLGAVLDPSITSHRKGPAVFSNGRQAARSENIKDGLNRLSRHLEGAGTPMTKEEALEYYYAFQEIHPLKDGNGRIGMLLYNILRGTMENPEIPEDKPGWN